MDVAQVTLQRSLSSTVEYEVRGDVAVIRLMNPPVNGLGDTTRIGISAGIAAAQDPGVRAVIVIGAGKGFCGGADLRQFGTPAAAVKPSVSDVFAEIQALRKPVVAAIHGFALGGGLELALVCNYRIADREARLGLPEVNVGLLPGAGGTQRLPRLIGAAQALTMIQSGSTVTATRAAELGIVDSIVDGDLLDAALALLDDLPAHAALPVIDDNPPADPVGVDFDAARARLRPSTRNRLAQSAAIDAVQAATTAPIADGLAHERAAFVRLVASPEAAALRHVFFAERQAAKVADIAPTVTARTIDRVAVVGAGTMGTGIAMALANGGYTVDLIEQNADALDRGTATIRANYEATAAKGRLTAQQVEQRIAAITPSLDLHTAATADLVVEAVFEDMDVKKQVFAALDTVCKPGAVLATNTSRLDVDEIARSISRPGDVIGLHFFSPANVMKLLEVVRADSTADDVVVTALTMARRIGKAPVVSKVCEGFIGNRMLTPYRREADFLIEEGTTPQRVDAVLQNFGFAMGPFAVADLAGLDIGWAARKRQAPTRPAHLRYSRVADILCEAGRFGQKTGAGYYRYESGSRTPHPDPFVDDVVRRCADEDGIPHHEISDDEIIDRTMLALVNEGAKILGETVAQRASDIDVVYVNGYGFPAHRGGPMHYADTLGLPAVLDKIRALEATHGEVWTPAPLIEQLVHDGHTSFE